MVKPSVAVISTGGTIAGVGADSLDFFNYGSRGRFMKGDELIAGFPELESVASVKAVPYDSIGSTAMGPRPWLALADAIHAHARENPDTAGFVVTHGTAALEETAYFLNLALKIEQTVVVVGAQLPPTALGSDAGLNIYNAVRVAASPKARGLGVLVVLNGEINAAREVSKTSTFRFQTFRSQDLGVFGYVDGDDIAIYRRPTRIHAPDTEFDVAGMTDLPRVDIVPTYAGSDGVMIDAAVAAGAKGIVSAGMAPGMVTPDQAVAFRAAHEKGILLVQSSRVGEGRITGARLAILDAHMIPADTLSPQKARILLMLALTKTSDPKEIAGLFERY